MYTFRIKFVYIIKTSQFVNKNRGLQMELDMV